MSEYKYAYTESVVDSPNGVYGKEGMNLSICTSAPQGEEDRFYIFTNPIEDWFDENEIEDIEYESDSCINIVKTISKDDFKSKFDEAINLAKKMASSEVKGVKFLRMNTPEVDDLLIKYYGDCKNVYNGLSIDTEGCITVGTENCESSFVTDAEMAMGLLLNDKDFEYEDYKDFKEITEEEFIEEFNKRIQLTEAMYKE